MAKKPTAVPRDTTTHSAAEIRRRFTFVVYALALPVGFAALLLSQVRHQPALIAVTVVAVIGFICLHRTRTRWGARELADEIARNPFKVTAPQARSEPRTDGSGH